MLKSIVKLSEVTELVVVLSSKCQEEVITNLENIGIVFFFKNVKLQISY